MTVSFPAGISARGQGALWFIPAIATPATGVHIAEFTAGVNLSCAIAGFAPTAEQGVVNKTRYCSTGSFEIPGSVTNTGPTLEYVYDPQEPDSDEYEWYSVLKKGVKGYLGNRLGLDFDAALAANQFVNVYPVEFGQQVPIPIDSTADGDELRISQRVFITGDPRYGVKVLT